MILVKYIRSSNDVQCRTDVYNITIINQPACNVKLCTIRTDITGEACS